jgi:hypothetical protein
MNSLCQWFALGTGYNNDEEHKVPTLTKLVIERGIEREIQLIQFGKPSLRNRIQWAGGVAQVAECLPRKHKALNLRPNPPKK